MAHKRVQDICKLCGKPGQLCKSHYLSKVLHTLSRTGGENPVVMTPELIKISPRQVWAHLLCSLCERRFNDRGEKLVLKLFNGANGFPLLERMNLARPVRVEPTVITYSGSGMGIETESLAYYALSVLWKGSVHKWKTVRHQSTSISLGKYQEPIRRYLLDQAGFPDGVYVIVAVCTDSGSQGMNFAPCEVAQSKLPMYSLLVRGLWFHVLTTGENPPGLSELCCIRSAKKVIFKEDCTKRFLEAGRHIHKTATVSTELRSSPSALRT